MAVPPPPVGPPAAHPPTPSLPTPAVLLCSLGCPKNTVDGEVLLGDLYRSGFEITDAHDEVSAAAAASAPAAADGNESAAGTPSVAALVAAGAATPR